MSGRIGVHLESGGRVQIAGGFEELRSQFKDAGVLGADVVYKEVQMDLLRLPVGPLRRHMIDYPLNGHRVVAVELYFVPILVRAANA